MDLEEICGVQLDQELAGALIANFWLNLTIIQSFQWQRIRPGHDTLWILLKDISNWAIGC